MKTNKVRRTTISDIAYYSGVSEATVSRALNNSRLVKEDTRNEIIDIAKKMNYQFNTVARSLRKMKSNIVQIAVLSRAVHISIESLAFINCISGILTTVGCTVIVKHYDPKDVERVGFSESIGIIGTIVVSLDLNSIEFQNAKVSPIFLGGTYCNTGVASNDELASYFMCHYMLKRGSKRIAYVYEQDDAYSERYKGFVKCMKAHGIYQPPTLKVSRGGEVVAAKNTQKSNLIDTLIYSTDTLCPRIEGSQYRFGHDFNLLTRIYFKDEGIEKRLNAVIVAQHNMKSLCEAAVGRILQNPGIEENMQKIDMTYVFG